MTRRLAFHLPILLFAIVAGYLVVALQPGRDPTVLPSALFGKIAPAISLPPLLRDLPGIFPADLKGRVVLVNFFASWCIPCRAEHPLLLRLARDEQVEVLGIAYKNKPEQARDYLLELGNPYSRVGLDESGRAGIEFGIYGVPETFVIDQDGIIRYREAGPLTTQLVEEYLLPLIVELRSQ
ncbi:MAG: DsbE family thiol:disulfide interchange protein [Dongiaceae bacterium]